MPADRPTPYRKFSPHRWLFFGGERLWAGGDHLLLVRSILGLEKYRRYYFQDVEGFIVRPTTAQRTWILILSIFLGIFALLTGIVLYGRNSGDGMAGVIILGSIAALFLLALLYHMVRGPTCASYLQLRTGLEPLAVANRLRAAQKMRDRLVDLIGASSEARTVAPMP